MRSVGNVDHAGDTLTSVESRVGRVGLPRDSHRCGCASALLSRLRSRFPSTIVWHCGAWTERTPVSPQPISPSSAVREAGDPSTSVMAALRSPKRLRTEVLAGLVVALALIPEAISFSIIAGVDPRVGLFSSFTMAVTIAIVGGRPAMISAATGAIALVVAPLARQYGLDYLVAAVLLAGMFQILLSVLGVARLMRFIPRSVMVGFVNALAILIFTSQLPHLLGVPALVYPFVAVGLIIMVFLPRLTSVVPAPLVAIVLLTAAAIVFSVPVAVASAPGLCILCRPS